MKTQDDYGAPLELQALQKSLSGATFEQIGRDLRVTPSGAKSLVEFAQAAVIACSARRRAGFLPLRELGFKRYSVAVHPDDWAVVKALVDSMREARHRQCVAARLFKDSGEEPLTVAASDAEGVYAWVLKL